MQPMDYRLAKRALAIIESAYSTPEWLRGSRTPETDRVLEEMRTLTGSGDTARTPAPGCPACLERRRHTREELGFHHPCAGSR